MAYFRGKTGFLAGRGALFVLLLAVLFFGCGCGRAEKAKNGRVRPEVLLAQECGFDRLPCCQSEPSCSYGQQCCADPNNSNNNHCADDCTCGDEEEFCCAGNQCFNSLVCRWGICLACGGENEICCPGGASCQDGLACSDDKCVPCGVSGNPCCVKGEKCLEQGSVRSECFEGSCRDCGADGLIACQEGEECLPGQIHTNGYCERCGGENEPCCDKTAAVKAECDAEKKLKCELGFCSKAE